MRVPFSPSEFRRRGKRCGGRDGVGLSGATEIPERDHRRAPIQAGDAQRSRGSLPGQSLDSSRHLLSRESVGICWDLCMSFYTVVVCSVL